MRTSSLFVVLLVCAACASSGEDDAEFITDFTAQISPMTGQTVRGSTRAVASIGRTVVTTEIEGAAPDAVHPWHVHRGTCGSGGPVVGDASDYSPLRPDSGGEDRSTATIDVQLDDDTDYYVNIHASPTMMGTIVACGALVD